jgi:hypothetical protein
MNTTDQAVRDELAFARRRLTFHRFQTDYHDSAQAVKDREARRQYDQNVTRIREISNANKAAHAEGRP